MADSQKQRATDSNVSGGTSAGMHWVAFDVRNSEGQADRHTRYFSDDQQAERDTLIKSLQAAGETYRND
jgi:hypothetical protein